MCQRLDEQVGSIAAQAAGRRDFMGALGTMGMALLATLGFTEASTAQKKRKRKKRQTPPSATSVVRVGEFVEGSSASSFATCNPGEHAVSGGFELFNADFSSVKDIQNVPDPSNDGAVPTRWFARVSEGGNAMGIQAYVICVPD